MTFFGTHAIGSTEQTGKHHEPVVLKTGQHMKKLLKDYGLHSVEDYRAMVRASFHNGQKKQAKEQFMAMPKSERIAFLKDLIFYYDESYTKDAIFFFNTFFSL